MVQTDHRALGKAGTTLHLEHELTGCGWDATLPRSMADLPVNPVLVTSIASRKQQRCRIVKFNSRATEHTLFISKLKRDGEHSWGGYHQHPGSIKASHFSFF